MVRKMFAGVIAVALVGLLGAGLAAAAGTPSGSGASPGSGPTSSNVEPQKPPPPQQAAKPGVAERLAAEQQAQVLSGQQLATEQARAKAYVAQMAGDPDTIVCLTAQGTLGLVISMDRPAGAKPLTLEEKHQSCRAHLSNSHAAS